jgi:hypothetical protein
MGMTWGRVSSAGALALGAFAALVYGRISGPKDISGTAPRMSRKPSQDAMLLLSRREVLASDLRNLRRQHKARLICSRELQWVTHELLRGGNA